MTRALHIALLLTALALPNVLQAQESHKRRPSQDLPELTAEEEEALLRDLEERSPEAYQHLMSLSEDNPQAFHTKLAKVATHLEEGDRERLEQKLIMHGAERELQEMVEQYRELAEREQREAREHILAKSEELFELRQEMRRRQLETISEKLEQLSAEIDERDRRRQELIEEFVAEVLGEKPHIEGL
jgi:hypothetical protein